MGRLKVIGIDIQSRKWAHGITINEEVDDFWAKLQNILLKEVKSRERCLFIGIIRREAPVVRGPMPHTSLPLLVRISLRRILYIPPLYQKINNFCRL